MLGHDVKEASSGTSRSGKVNDRLRRTAKHAEKQKLKLDIRAGVYNRLQPW